MRFSFKDVLKMQLNKLKKLMGTFRNNDDNIIILFILCASAVAAIGIFPPFLIIVIFLYEVLNYIEEL